MASETISMRSSIDEQRGICPVTSLKRLPLENAYNIRELGGYPSENNQVTAFRQFLRGDDVARLSKADINYLINYGVTAVIDLRSSYEIEYAPNPLAQVDDINYLDVSLLPVDTDAFSTVDNLTEVLAAYGEEILAKLYVDILTDEQENLRRIFEFIAKQDGCVLFHCAAGKDRTGVIAMLLLGLASVSRADIIANYMVTEIYNTENPYERVVNLPIELPESLLASNPKSIAAAYDFVMSTYGSFIDYLRAIKVPEATIETVKNKLISNKDNLL